MKAKPKVGELSPDGFTRFFFLVDFLYQIYGDSSKKISILDVGGGSEFFEQQLKKAGIDYELTIIDILERPNEVKARYIQGDATQMLFEDASFDVVVSTDVMEHIPEDRKQAFLNESLRVSRDACIIGAPFMTPGVDAAERTVNEFNKLMFGVGQDWLEEHLSLGKPHVEMFEKTLKENSIPYHQLGTQNITTWLLNTHINLIDAKLGLDTEKHRKINKFYNNNTLSMNEFEGMTYRQFFIMFTNKELKKKFDIQRYGSDKNSPENYSRYVSSLMQLFSDRIIQMTNERVVLEKQADTLKADVNSAHDLINDLNRRIEDQEGLLQKAEPYFKLINSRPAVSIRKLKNWR